MPILAIGDGEELDDIKDFDSEKFAREFVEI
jgi:signal recognition particle GTPase